MSMGLYLVVANQTALSDELTTALLDKVKLDESAEFVLVVPATPVEYFLNQEEGHARQIAARRAGRALIHLTDAGVPIVGAHVGEASLAEAIDAAISQHTREYKGIIICTYPPSVSRWLTGQDQLLRLEAAFHLPVTQVVAIHGQVMGRRPPA